MTIFQCRFVIRSGLSLCAAMLALSATAEHLNIRHYDTRHGMPQLQVVDVHQDPQGYMWIGTYGGLARFNGEDFVRFGTGQGLNSNYINAISHDAGGSLWVGTAVGACRLQETQPVLFDCLDRRRLPEGMVNEIAAFGGAMWIAGESGLSRVEQGEVVAVDLPGDSARNGHSEVLSLAADTGAQRLWIGTPAGLVVRQADEIRAVGFADGGNRAVQALAIEGSTLWAGTSAGLHALDLTATDGELRPVVRAATAVGSSPVNHIHLADDGTLYIAAVNGLIRRRQGEDFQRLTVTDGLPSDIIHHVTTDREGIVWAGTDQGLGKILPGSFAGFSERSGLRSAFVRTIHEGARDRLWLGTREGLQIVEHEQGDLQLGDSEVIDMDRGLPDNRVNSLAFAGEGRVWIATFGGVALWDENEGVVQVLDQDDGLPSNETHALLLDREGRLWISTTRGSMVYREGRLEPAPDPLLAGAFALRIRQDEQGRLWFTSLRDGLLILEPDGELRQFRDARGLTDEMLWDMAPHHGDDSMWVGSNGDGLFRVWPDGRIERHTTADGLADNFVWQLLEDSDGRLWAYTNRGLSRFDGESFDNFGERDGLLHLEGVATAALETSDGQLWFSSSDGLMRYEGDTESSNRIAPPVVIESVRLDGEPVPAGARLEPGAGVLEFDFAGLSYWDPDNVRYRYRLVGAGERWSSPTANAGVSFASLGYGDYRFEVMARNPQGVWSEQPAIFAFSIAPPFWAHWWFYLLAAVLLVIAVRQLVRFRVRNIEARRARLEEVVAARTAELQFANQRLRNLSRTDQLTGLPNRRFLIDQINRDVSQSRRARAGGGDYPNQDIVFIMVDIDHFKQVNDRYGHDAGDRVLRQHAAIITGQLRETDYVVRWGGEEFLVVARDAEASRSAVIANRIVDATRENVYTADDHGAEIRLTCSAGVACYPFFSDDTEALDWEEVIQVADCAAYRAKNLGRNRWIWFRPGPQAVSQQGSQWIRSLQGNQDEMIGSGAVEVVSSQPE